MATIEKVVEQSLLYDFYGELLNKHQRDIYEAALFDDLSLSEIAQEAGISRQGVHDLIKRCDRLLQQYESKLHLVQRFSLAKEQIEEICTLTNNDVADTNVRMLEIEKIAKKLLEEL